MLLIGQQSGGVSILKDGRFRRFDTEQTRRVDGVLAFAQETDGVIWATARNGLMRFDAKVWQVVGSDWHFPGGHVDAALVDDHGTLWVTTGNEVFRLPGGGRRFEKLKGSANSLST